MPLDRLRVMTARREVHYNNTECCREGSRFGWVLKVARMSEPRRHWKRLWIFKQGNRMCKAQRNRKMQCVDGGTAKEVL